MVEYKDAGCGVVGSAPSWGDGGRQFEPGQPDTIGFVKFRSIYLTSGFLWYYNKCMSPHYITCTYCNKVLPRYIHWIKLNNNFNYNHYCSLKCSGKNKRRRRNLICLNPKCKNKFSRIPSGISPNNYCSRSCAAIINNTKFPKNPGLRKNCKFCGKAFVSRQKYCSRNCKDRGHVVPKEKIIGWIKEFNKVNMRLPFKREYNHASAARLRFGTWNNAVRAAGFKPNPVMFARKHIANDGHKCDSLAEKIIDDWFHARKIKHEINVSYPGNDGFTVDFKVGKYWIEFFGLSGEHRKYDELKDRKLVLAKKQKLRLLEIYPRHLFPKSNLNEKLKMLMN